MLKSICTGTISALLVSGCSTSLTSYRDGQGPVAILDPKEVVHAGVVYHVPMLQFNITVTRTLAQCTRPAIDGSLPVSDIKFDYKVKAEPTYIAGERFVLDYETISSWSKTGEAQLDTYDNGVLKSLNSNISDDTAAIVANLVSTGVGVAKLVMGVPSIPNVAHSPLDKKVEMVCSQAAVDLLEEMKIASKTVKDREEELVDVSKKYDQLDRLLKLEIISEAQMVEMANLLAKQEKAEIRLKAAQGVAESSLALLSATDQVVWPRRSLVPDGTGRIVESLDMSPANRKKLLGLFVLAKENSNISGPGRNEMDIKTSLAARVALQSVTESTNAGCDDKKSCDDRFRDHAGLFYRSPVPAQLMVCQTEKEDDCLVGGATSKLLGQPVMAPQLGALRFLPLTNGAFQNNSLSASFRPDGTIASVTYKELQSRGKALSGSLAAAVETAMTFRDEVETQKDIKRKEKKAAKDAQLQDELDALDHQIAVRKKQDELDKLNVEDPTEGNQAASDLHLSYATLAEAERKRLEAEKALIEARKQSASSVEGAQ